MARMSQAAEVTLGEASGGVGRGYCSVFSHCDGSRADVLRPRPEVELRRASARAAAL